MRAKKSIHWVLLGLVMALVSSCERVEIRKKKHQNGNLKARWEVTVSSNQELKNGVYEEWYENKQQKLIVNYVDNHEHGVYRAYYKNGEMESEMYFLKGSLHGESKEWYDNGKKKREANYKKGKLHGTVITWTSAGKRVAKAKFKNGACTSGNCDQLSDRTALKADK